MGIQHVEKGLDITTTGQLFTVELNGGTSLDVYIDGDGSADYEVYGGPNESRLFPTAIATATGGTDYAITGQDVSCDAIGISVTATALSGGETADVYVASRD